MGAGGNPLASWPLVTALVSVHVFQLCQFNPTKIIAVISCRVTGTKYRSEVQVTTLLRKTHRLHTQIVWAPVLELANLSDSPGPLTDKI